MATWLCTRSAPLVEESCGSSAYKSVTEPTIKPQITNVVVPSITMWPHDGQSAVNAMSINAEANATAAMVSFMPIAEAAGMIMAVTKAGGQL